MTNFEEPGWAELNMGGLSWVSSVQDHSVSVYEVTKKITPQESNTMASVAVIDETEGFTDSINRQMLNEGGESLLTEDEVNQINYDAALPSLDCSTKECSLKIIPECDYYVQGLRIRQHESSHDCVELVNESTIRHSSGVQAQQSSSCVISTSPYSPKLTSVIATSGQSSITTLLPHNVVISEGKSADESSQDILQLQASSMSTESSIPLPVSIEKELVSPTGSSCRLLLENSNINARLTYQSDTKLLTVDQTSINTACHLNNNVNDILDQAICTDIDISTQHLYYTDVGQQELDFLSSAAVLPLESERPSDTDIDEVQLERPGNGYIASSEEQVIKNQTIAKARVAHEDVKMVDPYQPYVAVCANVHGVTDVESAEQWNSAIGRVVDNAVTPITNLETSENLTIGNASDKPDEVITEQVGMTESVLTGQLEDADKTVEPVNTGFSSAFEDVDDESTEKSSDADGMVVQHQSSALVPNLNEQYDCKQSRLADPCYTGRGTKQLVSDAATCLTEQLSEVLTRDVMEYDKDGEIPKEKYESLPQSPCCFAELDQSIAQRVNRVLSRENSNETAHSYGVVEELFVSVIESSTENKVTKNMVDKDCAVSKNPAKVSSSDDCIVSACSTVAVCCIEKTGDGDDECTNVESSYITTHDLETCSTPTPLHTERTERLIPFDLECLRSQICIPGASNAETLNASSMGQIESGLPITDSNLPRSAFSGQIEVRYSSEEPCQGDHLTGDLSSDNESFEYESCTLLTVRLTSSLVDLVCLLQRLVHVADIMTKTLCSGVDVTQQSLGRHGGREQHVYQTVGNGIPVEIVVGHLTIDSRVSSCQLCGVDERPNVESSLIRIQRTLRHRVVSVSSLNLTVFLPSLFELPHLQLLVFSQSSSITIPYPHIINNNNNLIYIAPFVICYRGTYHH